LNMPLGHLAQYVTFREMSKSGTAISMRLSSQLEFESFKEATKKNAITKYLLAIFVCPKSLIWRANTEKNVFKNNKELDEVSKRQKKKTGKERLGFSI